MARAPFSSPLEIGVARKYSAIRSVAEIRNGYGMKRNSVSVHDILLLLLLLLLYDMYVSCHRPFLPGTSLEPAVIPTVHASNFTLRYFPYYV